MTDSLTPTWEPRIVLQMLVASDDAAQPRGIMDCVDNDGKPYQSAHMAKLVEHARALVTAPTTIGERQAIAEGVAKVFAGHDRMDREGLERWRSIAKETHGHDLVSINATSLTRILNSLDAALALATPTTNAPVADREALQHKLRMVVSHATGGSSQDIDASVNDICVEITRMRNMVWEGGRQSALRDAAKAQTLPIHGEMREALEQAITLIDEINERAPSRAFWGICQSLHAKLCTIRATLVRSLRNPSNTGSSS